MKRQNANHNKGVTLRYKFVAISQKNVKSSFQKLKHIGGGNGSIGDTKKEKSRIQETKHLSTDADSSTDAIGGDRLG